MRFTWKSAIWSQMIATATNTQEFIHSLRVWIWSTICKQFSQSNAFKKSIWNSCDCAGNSQNSDNQCFQGGALKNFWNSCDWLLVQGILRNPMLSSFSQSLGLLSPPPQNPNSLPPWRIEKEDLGQELIDSYIREEKRRNNGMGHWDTHKRIAPSLTISKEHELDHGRIWPHEVVVVAPQEPGRCCVCFRSRSSSKLLHQIRIVQPKKTEKTNTKLLIKQSILVKWMILKYSLLGNIQDQNQTEFWYHNFS